MTDDTARLILQHCDNDTFEIADLHAMAKLWLMRDEICSHLDPHDPVRTDIEKLAAIAGESEDGV